jgi:hypothetical protein
MAECLALESLVQKQVEITPAVCADPERPPPPAVLFYRESRFGPAVRPTPTAVRTCTCGAVAAVRCMSCVTFDVRGLGLQCVDCFRRFHPPFRVPHKWVNVNETEDMDHAWVRRLERFNAEERLSYAQDLLSNAQRDVERVASLEFKESTEERLRHTARKIAQVETRIKSLHSFIRSTVLFTPEERIAAVAIQTTFRRHWYAHLYPYPYTIHSLAGLSSLCRGASQLDLCGCGRKRVADTTSVILSQESPAGSLPRCSYPEIFLLYVYRRPSKLARKTVQVCVNHQCEAKIVWYHYHRLHMGVQEATRVQCASHTATCAGKRYNQ